MVPADPRTFEFGILRVDLVGNSVYDTLSNIAGFTAQVSSVVDVVRDLVGDLIANGKGLRIIPSGVSAITTSQTLPKPRFAKE